MSGADFLILLINEENCKVMKKEISVIVPVGEVKGQTYKCIDSLLNQSYKRIKLFFVPTSNIIKSSLREYIKNNEAVVTESYEQVEQGVLRVIRESKSEFFSIVMSEDYVLSDYFESIMEESSDKNFDVLKAKYYEVDCTNEDNLFVPNKFGYIDESKRLFKLLDNPEILYSDSVFSALLVRRDYFLKNDFSLGHILVNGFQDNVFNSYLIRVLMDAESIYYPKSIGICHTPSNMCFKATDAVVLNEANELLKVIHYINDTTLNVDAVKKILYAYVIRFIKKVKFVYCNFFSVEIAERINEVVSAVDRNVFSKYFGREDQELLFDGTSMVGSIDSGAEKVLIYNWLPYNNPQKWGGGVTVYCKNVIETVEKEFPGTELFFLSSGFAYDSTTTEIYYRAVNNPNESLWVHQIEIVNSPVPAEQRWLYKNPSIAIQNDKLKEVVDGFLKQFGEFKAIHFNNIEGLSLDVFDLKKKYPKTRFIYSLHNYVPICVNGSYYMRHLHCNCNPAHTAEDCIKCTRADIRSDFSHNTYMRGVHGDESKLIDETVWVKTLGFDRMDVDVSEEHILDFARIATKNINDNCDVILAVSKRVREIAIDNGFDPNKTVVSYIGTKVAENAIKPSLHEEYEYPLKIVFLGNDFYYEEKGFPFLMDALSKLEDKYARKVDLFMTVKQPVGAIIKERLSQYHDIKIKIGYTHKDFDEIFRNAALSIIPVMWEDNLPQIAIESVAYGVPVLASSAGGASELSDNQNFKFECGNIDDFINKLKLLIDSPCLINEYWAGHNGLVTLKEHATELMNIWNVSSNEREIHLSMDWLRLLKSSISRGHAYIIEGNVVNQTGIALNNDDIDIEMARKQEVIDELEWRLSETRKSLSYRLGYGLTAIPRKIRSVIRKI